MDPVRFGRALGVGTREVAKALVRAADAAAAPNPGAKAAVREERRAEAPTPRSATDSRSQAQRAVRTVRQARTESSRVLEAGRAAGKQVLAPVSRAAGVLWYEITGVFFGIFAAGMGFEVWHRRLDFRAGGDARLHAWLVLAIGMMFTWFTVGSFLSAKRRNRR